MSFTLSFHVKIFITANTKLLHERSPLHKRMRLETLSSTRPTFMLYFSMHFCDPASWCRQERNKILIHQSNLSDELHGHISITIVMKELCTPNQEQVRNYFIFKLFHLQNIQIGDSPDLILRLTLDLKFICFTYNAKQNIKFVSRSKNFHKITWKWHFQCQNAPNLPCFKKDLEKKSELWKQRELASEVFYCYRYCFHWTKTECIINVWGCAEILPFAVPCKTTTWNDQISGFLENVSVWWQVFRSLSLFIVI